MRTETKIALVCFAAGTLLKYLLLTTEFISGLLFGLSLLFMIIGLLPENTYSKLKKQQMKKLSFFKRLVRLN